MQEREMQEREIINGVVSRISNEKFDSKTPILQQIPISTRLLAGLAIMFPEPTFEVQVTDSDETVMSNVRNMRHQIGNREVYNKLLEEYIVRETRKAAELENEKPINSWPMEG